jgi:hypothetical protein
MNKMTIEMAPVSKCYASQCAYNQNNSCHAKAITVGDGLQPECDTFLSSQTHTQEKTRIAGVGACKIISCKFNSDFDCSADKIKIGMLRSIGSMPDVRIESAGRGIALWILF